MPSKISLITLWLRSEEEDLFMRLFIQSLEGDVLKWFRTLPPNSLHSWNDLEITFHTQRGNKEDFHYYLTRFSIIKKIPLENVRELSKIFNKIDKKVQNEIKPTTTTSMVSYVVAFEQYYFFIMRERRPRTLTNMQF